jgi:hypothetical protein
MQRSDATVVALVGPGARELVPALGRAGRIRSVAVDPELPPLERAALAQRGTAGAGAALAVHDADPLAAVVDAWVRLFDGAGAAGELEVARGAALARWRARAVELPDYYLLLDPDAWDATRRHWYLGVLSAAAPPRVVPLRTTAEVQAALRRLPAGRWWPPLDRLLADVEHQVPDRLVSTDAEDAPTLLRPAR